MLCLLLVSFLVPGASAASTFDEDDQWCPDILVTWGGVPSCKVHVEQTVDVGMDDCAIDPDTGLYHSCFF